MNRKYIFKLTALLILIGCFSGVSCAKKQISSNAQTTADTAATRTMSDDTGSTNDGIDSESLNDSMARQKAAEEAALKQAAKQAFFDKHILFSFDSAQLDDTAKDLTRRKADWLRNNPNVNIVVEGHCDMRGTTTYNLALGERRAMAVKKYLEDLGVSPDRLEWVSYGEERPIAQGRDEESLRLNRRAQFRIRTPE